MRPFAPLLVCILLICGTAQSSAENSSADKTDACTLPESSGQNEAAQQPALDAEAFDSEQFALATDAYIWGFPRLIYEKYLLDFENAGAAFNRLYAMSTMATPNTGQVNVDTLYGVGWLDLGEEPMILDVPDAKDRYYSIQMVDTYANNFAYVGRRATGTKAQRHLIVPHGWQGEVIADMPVIRAPSRYVFLFLRTLVDNEADLADANAFNGGIGIAPLSTFPQGLQRTGLMTDLGPYFPVAHSHIDRFGAAYFDRLGDALKRDPPTNPGDLELMARFVAMGVGPGKHPATEKSANQALLAKAVACGHQKIFAAVANTARGGWAVNMNFDAGRDDPLFKATINRVGLGMHSIDEAIYLTPAALDWEKGDPLPTWLSMGPDGKKLTGDRRYRLYFPPGQLPEVDAFWSLTLNMDSMLLYENPLKRFAIGDRTPGLVYGKDGSLEILIQRDQPASGTSNWLPAPEGVFHLIFRGYQPRKAFLDGSYWLPPLEIMDN